MEQLADNIRGSFDARVKYLGKNVVETHRLLHDAQKFLGNVRRDRRSMARRLHADLGGFVDNLKESVGSLRNKFGRQQKAFHQECKTAHQAWARTEKALNTRRRNFKGELAKAKQAAGRVH